MTGYMYILKCSNGNYYVGSTVNIELRIQQHQMGEGAKYTKKHLPVELVYYEIYPRIDQAFAREKQIQGWRREKKEALINNKPDDLHLLAVCNNNTSHKNFTVTERRPIAIGRSESKVVEKIPRKNVHFGSAQ